jgi:hypothetical protein
MVDAHDQSIQKIILINQDQHIENFYNSNSNFFRFGASQVSLRMVDSLLNSSKIPEETKITKLKQLVFQIFNETCLNELEVAAWAMILESSVWPSKKYELSLALINSAVFSKEILGEDVEYLLLKFSEKVFDFRTVYKEWKRGQPEGLSVKRLNSMYKALNKGKTRVINYNYYVDDVLFQYLPYNNPKKNQKNDLKEQTRSSPPLLPEFLNSLEPLPLIAGNSGSVSNYINFDV